MAFPTVVCAIASDTWDDKSDETTNEGYGALMKLWWATPSSASTGNLLAWEASMLMDECQYSSATREILMRPSRVPPIYNVGIGKSYSVFPAALRALWSLRRTEPISAIPFTLSAFPLAHSCVITPPREWAAMKIGCPSVRPAVCMSATASLYIHPKVTGSGVLKVKSEMATHGL